MCIYINGFSWYFHGKQKKFHMNFNDPGIEQVCITTVQFGNYMQTLCSSLFDGAASFSKPKWAVYRTIASEKNIQSAGVTTVFEKKQKLKFHTDTPQLPKGGNKSVFGYSPHCDYMSVFYSPDGKPTIWNLCIAPFGHVLAGMYCIYVYMYRMHVFLRDVQWKLYISVKKGLVYVFIYIWIPDLSFYCSYGALCHHVLRIEVKLATSIPLPGTALLHAYKEQKLQTLRVF